MIQTKILKTILTGLNLLIVQKEIKSPKGKDKTKVNINSKQVTAKPPKRLCVTSKKLISVFLCYFWEVKSVITMVPTLYLFANSCNWPVKANASSITLTFAVNSLPFLKPIA